MWFQILSSKVITAVRWRLFNPKTPRITQQPSKLIRFGSRYGGKYVDVSVLDKNCVVVSGGAGEDISFEIELQNQFGLTIYLIDPTPEAIQHFNSIKERGPKKRELEYSNTSRQDPNSYDTSELNFAKVSYFQKALWNESTELKLYEPRDGTRDSSHSISGIHNNYRKNTPHIIVSATTIPELFVEIGLNRVDLLKLDIEGAALEVLESTFNSGILPKQIILEVDEMHFPGPRSWLRARRLFKLLESVGYICVNRDNCDFTFVRI